MNWEEIKISDNDKKKYPLPEKKDIEILKKIKFLEGKKIDSHDKKMVEFIRSQLEDEWRNYLIETLDKLLEKYKK
ncbi:MAG: hypothetical protein ABIH72_02010 [archaeon]